MNVPTPAALKKKLDEKRASEITPRQAGKTSKVEAMKSGSSTKEDSSKPRSSRKVRDSERSSSRTSRPKRSTSSQGNTPRSSREDSVTTENSPRKDSPSSERSKRDFKRPDHLIHRPLLDHEGLWALMNQMNASTTDTGYFEWADEPGRTKQSKNNKENN